MDVKKVFDVDNITGVSASISMPFTKNDNLTNIIKMLNVKNFKTTSAYTSKWHDSVDPLFSLITFNGDGFAFGLTKTKIAAHFLQRIEFVDVESNASSYDNITAVEIFTGENLASISSDFNYILGLIFGKLNFENQDYQLTFNIDLSKEMFEIKNLNQMITNKFELCFGNDAKLKGIQTDGHERLFGQDVDSKYHLSNSVDDSDDQNSCILSCMFQLQHSGPLDFFKLIDESINRGNDLIMNIMENANVTNS